ncbi:MAG: DNA/RNA non-specific endonuclease [Alistipes sp.]|nr:DNA/RNA non-specific endonuclease [Alistipes sp.]
MELEKPTLSATNITSTSFDIVWNAIDNADGYEVVTSAGAKTIYNTQYKMENLVAGTYTVQVKALAGENTQYKDSQYATISQYVEGEKQDEQPIVGNTYRMGWFELPMEADNNKDGIDDNNDTYYYAHHLCGGSEKNAQRNGRARNYSVCFSSEHHCPVWVAAPRHSMYSGSANRTNAYTQDPQIPSDIQYYRKDADSGCNNGHMLGSAERTSSTETNSQVFYFSNIAPQYSDTFNTGGGAWNNLEDHIDGLVCADTLYTVIGCYFDKYTDKYGNTGSPKKISFGGRSDVSCPTMFYYALLRTKSGRSGKSVVECSASELQCAAFVICHEQEKGHEPQAKDIISIEELERLTGFTYFNNVPNAPKSVVNASDWL